MAYDKPTTTNTRIAHRRAYQRAVDHFLEAMIGDDILELSLAAQELSLSKHHMCCDQIRIAATQSYEALLTTIKRELFSNRELKPRKRRVASKKVIKYLPTLEAAMKSSEKRKEKGDSVS